MKRVTSVLKPHVIRVIVLVTGLFRQNRTLTGTDQGDRGQLLHTSTPFNFSFSEFSSLRLKLYQ